MQMARRSKATNAFTCLSRSPSSGIPPDWLIDDCFEDKDRRRLDRSPRAPPSTCFQSRLDQNYKPIQLSKRQLFRDDILPHILIDPRVRKEEENYSSIEDLFHEDRSSSRPTQRRVSDVRSINGVNRDKILFSTTCKSLSSMIHSQYFSWSMFDRLLSIFVY